MLGDRTMKTSFHIGRNSPAGKTKPGWRGNPICLVLLGAVLIYFVNLVFSIGKFTRDTYAPYEGQVLEVTTSWKDWFVFESAGYEHLVIKTPEGNKVDRFIPMEIRAVQNIAAGDYVVKEKGFRNRVRPRDKKTAQEVMDGALEQKRDSRKGEKIAGEESL